MFGAAGPTPAGSAAGAVKPHLAVALIAAVYLAVRTFWFISAQNWRALDSAALEAVVKIGLWVVPCVVLLMLPERRTPRAAWKDLGLGGAAAPGLLFGFLATIPMAFALGAFSIDRLDFDLILNSALVGPFAEEVLFRGFLFWQLVRRAGWSLPGAIGVSAAMFGLAHLRDIDFQLLTVVGGPAAFGMEAVIGRDVTVIRSAVEMWLGAASRAAYDVTLLVPPYALGGALFAWVTYRWRSLWPAVALHTFMNLWWVLAQGEHPRLEFEITPMTIAHGLSIALAVGLTLARSRLRT